MHPLAETNSRKQQEFSPRVQDAVDGLIRRHRGHTGPTRWTALQQARTSLGRICGGRELQRALARYAKGAL
jgi:hypothetical protein